MKRNSQGGGWWSEVERIMFIISVAFLLAFVALFFLARNNQFIQNLSIELFSVALLFVLSQVFLKNFRAMRAQEDTEILAERIAQVVNSHANSIADVLQAGITDAYELLPLSKLKQRIGHSKRCVRIMHTFIDDPRQYKEAFAEANCNGSSIQLLFLNPESPYAKQRSLDVWPKNSLTTPDEQYVSKQITYSIDVLYNMVKESEIKNVEVRIYDSLPSLALYMTDDDILLGFFLIGTKTDSATMLSVSGNSFFSRDLINEFEKRWANAKPISLE